ncbi:MAG: hypothetical protein ACR2O4_15185, partial [Hyphomicrobiaceae bacterium]
VLSVPGLGGPLSMFSFFGRASQVISVIFLSFILGAILAGITAFYYPSWFDQILDYASDLKGWLSNDWLPLEVNVWFKFLLKDEALVLMFFTVLARIILYTLFGLFNMLTASFRTPNLTRAEARDLISRNKALQRELEDERRARAAAENARVATHPPLQATPSGGSAQAGGLGGLG